MMKKTFIAGMIVGVGTTAYVMNKSNKKNHFVKDSKKMLKDRINEILS